MNSVGQRQHFINTRPLTQEEKDELVEALTKEIMPIALETIKLNEELDTLKAQQKQHEENSLQHRANALELKERARELKTESQKNLEEAARLKNEKLTRGFYAVFNGKKELTPEEVQREYDKYLKDNTCSVVKDENGKSVAKINHMAGVINYLKDNQDNLEITTYNFSAFKKIDGISSLVNYLLETSTKVKTLSFYIGISQEAKESLKKLTEVKKDIQVKYLK